MKRQKNLKQYNPANVDKIIQQALSEPVPKKELERRKNFDELYKQYSKDFYNQRSNVKRATGIDVKGYKLSKSQFGNMIYALKKDELYKGLTNKELTRFIAKTSTLYNRSKSGYVIPTNKVEYTHNEKGVLVFRSTSKKYEGFKNTILNIEKRLKDGGYSAESIALFKNSAMEKLAKYEAFKKKHPTYFQYYVEENIGNDVYALDAYIDDPRLKGSSLFTFMYGS